MDHDMSSLAPSSTAKRHQQNEDIEQANNENVNNDDYGDNVHIGVHIEGGASRNHFQSQPQSQPLFNECNAICTANYCEENVWRILQLKQRKLKHSLNTDSNNHSLFAVFITNANRCVPFRRQRDAPNELCLWDYHVIVIIQKQLGQSLSHVSHSSHDDVEPQSAKTTACSDGLSDKIEKDSIGKMRNNTLVYDINSTLPFPTSLEEYVSHSFIESSEIEYYFRIVPFDELLNTFSSDRRHMKLSNSNTIDSIDGKVDEQVTNIMFTSPPPSTPCIRAGKLNNQPHTLPYFLKVPGLHFEDDHLGLNSGEDPTNVDHLDAANDYGTLVHGIDRFLAHF